MWQHLVGYWYRERGRCGPSDDHELSREHNGQRCAGHLRSDGELCHTYGHRQLLRRDHDSHGRTCVWIGLPTRCEGRYPCAYRYRRTDRYLHIHGYGTGQYPSPDHLPGQHLSERCCWILWRGRELQCAGGYGQMHGSHYDPHCRSRERINLPGRIEHCHLHGHGCGRSQRKLLLHHHGQRQYSSADKLSRRSSWERRCRHVWQNGSSKRRVPQFPIKSAGR